MSGVGTRGGTWVHSTHTKSLEEDYRVPSVFLTINIEELFSEIIKMHPERLLEVLDKTPIFLLACRP